MLKKEALPYRVTLFSMGHAGASRKSPNDAPWEKRSLRLSRPISAPLLTAVQGTCEVPAPLLTAVLGTCGVPAPLLTAVLSWRYEEEAHPALPYPTPENINESINIQVSKEQRSKRMFESVAEELRRQVLTESREQITSLENEIEDIKKLTSIKVR